MSKKFFDAYKQLNGFAVAFYKCEWAVQEMDWVGYWLMPSEPLSKRKDHTCNLANPATDEYKTTPQFHWRR
jgi:hypothetical protein